MHLRSSLTLILVGWLIQPSSAQLFTQGAGFTRADTLRGSIGPERAWWDVTHYDVSVEPDFATRSVIGTTIISFRAAADGQRMQVDLQEPLIIDRMDVSWKGSSAVRWAREGNILWVDLPEVVRSGIEGSIAIAYHGAPREARNPPWDGGWIWRSDDLGNPWMSVACQGLGASAWYPCKDHQGDEPDSAALHITVPDTLQAVGNGRLRSRTNIPSTGSGQAGQRTTWTWAVTSPINSYNLVPTIGKYAHFGEVYPGEQGPLDCDYWVLAYNEEKARAQFKQVPGVLKCFEEWLGPFPFYADGYKLVESPHLGMEHQSAVAYGNGYVNGYRGMDLSGSGRGLLWDYILVHESGHEWFGNNITTEDIADMWVHEGFTDYTETIFTQCQQGIEAGNDYVIGLRRQIANAKPVIGPYGVNQEGSGDMYYKGGALIHTIRHIMADDGKFKAMLRDMNATYRHQIVTSALIEGFISRYVGRDLSSVFDQYLRATQVPVFEWKVEGKRFHYRWAGCVPGFFMPVKITVKGITHVLETSTEWQALDGKAKKRVKVVVDRNWYVIAQRVH